MDLYTEADLPYVWGTLISRLQNSEVGILPTDTIYGISGNALDSGVLKRIMNIKGRDNPPSFIPHSINWARLLIDDDRLEYFDEYIESFRGEYTGLWNYTEKRVKLPPSLRSSGYVGLRLPNHWITTLSSQAGIPLITTSVNVHREPYMTDLNSLPDVIREQVDFMVFEGPLYGPPSAIAHCYDDIPFPLEERQ